MKSRPFISRMKEYEFYSDGYHCWRYKGEQPIELTEKDGGYSPRRASNTLKKTLNTPNIKKISEEAAREMFPKLFSESILKNQQIKK